MSLVNFTTREITCKIVYYGPGRSGKTTNLHYIYGRVPDSRRGRMVSLATQTDRTLFFDFLPIDLGQISGFATRFQLYTVPVVMQYNKQDLPRELILTPAELDDALNFRSVPSFPADALHGQGVFETLKAISELVLKRLAAGSTA